MLGLDKATLLAKFAQFDDAWQPYIIGERDGFYIKVAKMRGAFVWHQHVEEDELFWVVRGELRILFRDREVVLAENDYLMVPHGTEHCPVADEEAWVVLLEPKTTRPAGDNGTHTAEPVWLVE